MSVTLPMPPNTKKPRGKRIEPRWAAITAAVVAIIIWGSLYPFQFFARGSFDAAVRYLLMSRHFRADRGDVLSNILLYAPLGFFAVRSLRRVPFALSVVIAAVFGTLLSTTMELTQFWDEGRGTSMLDLYSNAAGALFGALIAGLNPRAWNFPVLGKIEWRPYALLLVIFWLGNRLFPYVPALHWHGFAGASRLLSSRPAMWTLCRQTVDWLAAGMLLETLFGVERSRIAMALIAGSVLAARFVLGFAALPEDAGAAVAVLFWIGIVSRLRARSVLVAALFALSIGLSALEPFHFNSSPRPFGWTPFLSFIDGPRENGVRVFFDKAFTYGVFVWLAARAGASWMIATTLCTVYVLALRLEQIYIPGRSAEITDVAMLLMLAATMRVMRDVPVNY